VVVNRRLSPDALQRQLAEARAQVRIGRVGWVRWGVENGGPTHPRTHSQPPEPSVNPTDLVLSPQIETLQKEVAALKSRGGSTGDTAQSTDPIAAGADGSVPVSTAVGGGSGKPPQHSTRTWSDAWVCGAVVGVSMLLCFGLEDCLIKGWVLV